MIRGHSLLNLYVPLHQLLPSPWPKISLIVHQESQILTLLRREEMSVREASQVVRALRRPNKVGPWRMSAGQRRCVVPSQVLIDGLEMIHNPRRQWTILDRSTWLMDRLPIVEEALR